MRRMRYLVAMAGTALAIGAAAGCGGSDGLTAPPPLSAAELAGDWQFSHPRNDACYGANGAAVYSFHVDSSGANAAGLMTIALTPWTNGSFGIHYWKVAGSMNRATGDVVLSFWLVPDLAGQEFTGKIDAAGNVTGTLVDPKPGYLPQFVFVPCSFSMTGHRVTP